MAQYTHLLDTIYAEKIVVNHNTIVWRIPKPVVDNNFGMENILRGTGKLSLTKNVQSTKHHEIGRLIDEEKQIEMLFHPNASQLCDTVPIAYPIIGLPDTHIILEQP